MLNVEHYQLSAHLFVRLLGFIYFFAFGAFLFQIQGLLGSNGILPAERFFRLIKQRVRNPYYTFPSIFWFNCSDKMLMGVILIGTILSLLLIFGVYPPLTIFLLYILYLSIVSVGQDFLSFGWEMFLLEITVNAFFLSLTTVPNPLIWISLNLLLFRFHFQGGAVKYQSRDPNWYNLTGVAYHYQTQPLPNTQAWYFYKLPLWIHKISTAFMLFAEIIIPFFIFATEELRVFAFAILVGLQLFIWFTGNFSYLNHLTVVFCVILLSDKYLPDWFVPKYSETPLLLEIFLSGIGAILIFLQIINLWNHFFRPNATFRKILYAFQPFHIGNRYGIFAIMTTKRYEIVIEGSDDNLTWKEYLFYYKPSEVNRRPRRISPYQPRIDWQAWFLPFSNYDSEIWLQNFLYHLLKGNPAVLSLIRYNPFSEKPPKFVRVVVYDYVFTDSKTKKELGHWWKRTFIGHYSPTLSLRETQQSIS